MQPAAQALAARARVSNTKRNVSKECNQKAFLRGRLQLRSSRNLDPLHRAKVYIRTISELQAEMPCSTDLSAQKCRVFPPVRTVAECCRRRKFLARPGSWTCRSVCLRPVQFQYTINTLRVPGAASLPSISRYTRNQIRRSCDHMADILDAPNVRI
jgi:hypothetical protein